jgi:hypothetical protein
MSAYTREINEIWLGDCLEGVEGRKKIDSASYRLQYDKKIYAITHLIFMYLTDILNKLQQIQALFDIFSFLTSLLEKIHIKPL